MGKSPLDGLQGRRLHIRFVSLKLRRLLDQSKLTNHSTCGGVCVTGYVLEEVHTAYREQTTL